MSVSSLYNAFRRAASAGAISASILPLMGKLVAVLGVESLTLSQGDAERLPTAARLTGGTIWAGATNWALTLVGTVDEGGRDVLTLTLSARSAAGFVPLATLVPTLPYSQIAAAQAPGTVTQGESVLAPLGPEEAAITASAIDSVETPAQKPELAGWLKLTGTRLAPYIPLLGASRLALSGRIDPRTDAPVGEKVDLEAVAPAATGGWEKIPAEQVALLLTTATTDIYSLDTPQPHVSSVEM
ncbi:MAG TPA: hypothetical protein VEW25_11945, partial [Allosphingosinicella sp.]|nr:hypothetical protein [Allosphingosinicella sp.]